MFDSLIETRRNQRSSQRLSTLPAIVLLHVLVLGAIVIQKFLEVPEIHEPPIQVMFAQLAAPPPPPPPPPPAPAADVKPPTETPKVEPARPEEMVQPVEAPKPVQPDTSGAGGGTEGGSSEGVPGGEVGGVPGGVVGGIPGDTPAPPPSAPLRVGGDVSAPTLVEQAKPAYPPIARSAHVEGVVILEAVIHRDGTVGDIQVVQGVGMGCTEAAIEAVRKWRYKPGLQNGIAVDVYMKVRVRFELTQ